MYFLKKVFLFFVLFLFLCCKKQKAVVEQSQLRPTSFVLDESKVFTKSQINALNIKLRAYEKETTNELVVITKDTIIGNLKDYATDLGNSLGIGKKDKNNGILILLVKPKRSVRISTGYGAEKIITDSVCKVIIRDKMIPHFKNGYFYQGIDTGIDEIILKWQ